jgi:DNA-binding CsgD family transcriptional regulator
MVVAGERAVTEVVGRGPEIAAVLRWFGSSGPATLVIDGPAGLGKTTVWAAAVAALRDRGAHVLTSSPAEAESRLSYSGLADLLADELPLVRATLSRPQARALAIAMRLEEPGDRPADETAVARGFLAALLALGRARGSVLVAVDDVRWLDGPSLTVLLYAARRLEAEDRVRVLTTHRTGSEHPAGLDEQATAERLPLEVLSVGSIHRIIRLRTGHSLPRPRLLELYAAALGNPLHALELARTVASGGRIEGGSLAALFRARIATLPGPTRAALVLLAASADRSLQRLDPAVGGDFGVAAAAAVEAGLVTLDGGHAIPSHPLVTLVAYDSASDAARRAAHRALADTATNDEERALHVGRSLDRPSEDAAAVVEAAARAVLSRGVRAVAAGLFESAARLTPPEAIADRARRLLAASSAWFDSGDTARVESILMPLIDVLPAGNQRCEARWRLGKALDEAGRWRDATRLWQEALDESEDLALRSQVLCSLAITALYTDTLERAAALAADGVEEAERSADLRSLGRALAVQAFVHALRGDDGYRIVMDRALAIEASVDEPLGEWSPSVLAAECARHRGDTEAALRHYRAVLDRAATAGNANIEQWAAFGLAWTEIVVGDFAGAGEHADLVLDIADQTGVMGIPARTLRAHVDAWLGDLFAARTLVGEAIDRATAAGEATHRFGGLAVLGVIEGFAGDAATGAAQLAIARGLAGQLGLAHASALRMFLAEAELAALAGRLEQADAAFAAFEAAVPGDGPAWTVPLRRRALAAIQAARGDLVEAARELDAAAAEPASLAPDRGRALLALGSVLRRLRELRRSRQATEQALAMFQALGTPPWIGAAKAELMRLPGRRPEAPQRLTNAEAAIAALVAAGRTNREVAAELVLSVKTIEVTLTRIYEKLGVRSRAELAAQFREAPQA